MDIITKRRKELEEGVGVAIAGVAYKTLENSGFIITYVAIYTASKFDMI